MENETVLADDNTLGFNLQWLQHTFTPHSSFPAVGTYKSAICLPDKADVFVTVRHNPKLAHVD